jgi:CDP-diglyceride synthetase
MHAKLFADDRSIDRPRYVWTAIALEIFTAVGAIPVGLIFLGDPSGRSMQIPEEWIRNTVFGTFTIPGIYLLFVNGLAMLIAAALSLMRHRLAPWLTGVLGVGLVVWIAVQLVVMPEQMILQPIFMTIGFVLAFVALFWLRRTRQLLLW